MKSLQMRRYFLPSLILTGFIFSVTILNGQSKPYGSGNFGQWMTDEYGLPAYDYKQSASGEDFLHLLGNGSCNATAHGGGYVSLYSSKYFPIVFNNFSDKNYSGGFGWINDNGVKWSTLYADRPAGSNYRVVFGMGYMRKTIEYNSLQIVQDVFVPDGSDEVLMEKITFTNKSASEKRIDYIDYWDVALTWMQFNNKYPGWSKLTEYTDKVKTYYDPTKAAIKAVMEGDQGDFTKPSSTDPAKYSIFLSVLNENISSYDTRQATFMGHGTRAIPEQIARGKLSNSLDISGNLVQNDALLAAQVTLPLPANSSKTVYVIYGTALKGNENEVIDSYRSEYSQRLSDVIAKSNNVKLSLPAGNEWVAREMTWNNYYLMAGMLREEYFHTSCINQGGAYFYGWGNNICPRDVLQHLMPLSYTRPEFAKASLRYVLRMMKNTGRLESGTKFYGTLNEDSFDQSDTQFYLIWALSDYIRATRDRAFLDEVNTYYDGGSATVYEMLKQAYSFVINVTGKGEHNIIRVKHADWADGFLECAGNRSETIKRGESSMNQAMACFTYPLLKEIALSKHDVVFADILQTEIKAVRSVMNSACWKGNFYNRGWVIDSGNNFLEIGSKYPHLESNSFAMMADSLMSSENVASLIASLSKYNSDLNFGMRLANPNSLPPYGESHGTWFSPIHATIQGMIKHAYENSDAGSMAWQEFKKASLARHAELWPDIFYGITSGDDSYSPTDGTGYHGHNIKQLLMHLHSQELLSSIRFAGIWPDSEGYLIQPAFPFTTFSWESDRIKVSYTPKIASGFIKALGKDVVKMRVKIPGNYSDAIVKINGEKVSTKIEKGFALFEMSVNISSASLWEVSGSGKVKNY